MEKPSIYRSPSTTMRVVWLLLGAFFSLLTARVLLWEVRSVADLSADHILTIGAVVGAIAAGIFFWQMLWTYRFVTAAGLGIAFCAATLYCLVGSAGRGDEAAFEHNAAARQVNADRARAQRSRDEAKARYDSALVAEQAECSDGTGRKCVAKREMTGLRRTDFEVAERLLSQQKSEQRENGKLQRAAELISFFGSIEQERAEKGLALVWPFIPPLVCELLTIVFLHLGFGVHGSKPQHRSKAAGKVAQSPETVSPETDPPVDGGPRSTRKPSSTGKPSAEVIVLRPRVAPKAKAETLAYVQSEIAAGRAFPDQNDLAQRAGVTKSAISKWASEWQAQGLIIRTRVGRRKMISGA